MNAKRITISIFPDELQALRELCLIEGRTASNMIQYLVRQEMKKRQEEVEKNLNN